MGRIVSDDQALAVQLQSFPSPATPASLSDPLDSPALWRRACSSPDTVSVLPPEPGDVSTIPVSTPLTEPANQPNIMNMIVGGALAPVHPPLAATKQQTRPGPGLRLPSFQALGIAAPHPDRFGSLSFHDTMPGGLDGTSEEGAPVVEKADSPSVDCFTALSLDRPSHIELPITKPKLPPGIVQTPLRHDIATLTPPAEMGEPNWQCVVTSAPMESPSTDPGHINTNPLGVAPSAVPAAAPASSSTSQATQEDPPLWIDGALQVLLNTLREARGPKHSLRVLSHALPSPSSAGHIYPSIISGVHHATPSPQTEWINVFHAIQGRFNLADMPTSPPSTPGPAIGGEDYFTRKVFDSAVPITDYQEVLSTLPRSPRPVVPPSSIDLSIVERYIPPTSIHEYTHMFQPAGPSILVDRLVELSPQKGSLVFIYPTKFGAQTFMQEYLGPIIDPLLRSIMVVNGFGADLSTTLGNMASVNHLLDFDQMERSTKLLCSRLSQRSASTPGFNGTKATFTVKHTSKANVRLNREAWARDWWTKQEKPRIREAMTKFSQEAQKKSSNEYIERAPTPTELVQNLVDSLVRRPYPSGQEPVKGVEVFIAVIERTE